MNKGCLTLLSTVFLLFLGSWFVSALQLDGIEIRSLLSSEGLRWVFCHYADGINVHIVLWIVYGVMLKTLYHFLLPLKYDLSELKVKLSFIVCTPLLIAGLGLLTLIAFIPHAILRSISGSVIDSVSAPGMVSYLLLLLSSVGLLFGLLSGKIESLTVAVKQFMKDSSLLVSLLVSYFILAQVWNLIKYVFIL